MAHLQLLFVRLEPIFLLLAAGALFRSGSVRRYPAFAAYFILRGVQLLFAEVVLNILGHGSVGADTTLYATYFWGYWISYLAIAISIFFVVQEVFKRVMEPVPGLRRLGLMAFRWISVVSIVVTVGAIALPAGLTASGFHMGAVADQTARCVSVMELCLLAFLALTIHSLGRSFRSRLFGMALGFGIQATADMVFTALYNRYPGRLASGAALFLQIVTLCVLTIWTAYFLAPEPEAERNMIVLPPQSMLSRWNALAKGLGQMPQPVVAGAPTGFFLADIEGVVDRVLAKNPIVNPR